MTFASLSLASPLLEAIKEEGYDTPTPIQARSIPIILKGSDILGCAQTGTGKTAAFTLPILQRLLETAGRQNKRPVRSLIVTPTRELAIQIDESVRVYGRHTGLTSTAIFGGVNQKSQVKTLRSGIDILIATPGRLLDLMNQGFISLSDVEIFVLDEADRMLDMGFINDVRKLLRALPKKRQTLLFSATMPSEIAKLSREILTNPEHVEVTPESSTVDAIRQNLFHVEKADKKHLLVDLLQDESITSALVFTRTKHGANKVVKLLNNKSIDAEAIHGNKSQAARQRALENFKDQTTRILVATDIAARGIDVDELPYVINYDLPNIPETYVHRIGRTGRAGSDGTALSFCDHEERDYLRDIENLIGKRIPVLEEHAYNVPVAKPAAIESPNGRSSAKRRQSRPGNSARNAGSRRKPQKGSRNHRS